MRLLVHLFIVLIERTWRHLARGCGAAAGALLLLAAGSVMAAASSSGKIAADLRQATGSSSAPSQRWWREADGQRQVKAVIVADSADATLADLRRHVTSVGGAVYDRYASIQALSVMLPADRVAEIAARSDVVSVSPNRSTARTASLLETASGTTQLRVSGVPADAALDGSGIGIAVLDSGIASAHQHFQDARGRSRVVRAVDLLQVGDALPNGQRDWRARVDAVAEGKAGRAAEAGNGVSDAYGHGSHVAGVAAGSGAYRLPDASGIARNASLVDVRVLDAAGQGQLADVLGGIDWVIRNARAHNIRVLNLSLAADSTESYLTDPLCRAVRAAVAAGITVVVAAGNYGLDASGAERFGTISAPGNEPSAITVGAANMKASEQRSDDVVTRFSSRGPTRGGNADAQGVRQPDNLLKPDLVAPGNRLVGVLAAGATGANSGWAVLPAAHPELAAPFGGYAQAPLQQLMELSGTSTAAPAVAGAVALMLQANPGLTPPLVKAILQYSAQALPGASLLQQGTGLLNVDGAVRLSRALRSDLASALQSRRLAAGD